MSILDHIRLHEANEFKNVDKPDDEVCILDDYHRFRDKLVRDHLAEFHVVGNKLSRIVKINVTMNLCVWMKCFKMIGIHTPLPRRKLNHIVRIFVKIMSLDFLIYCLKINVIIMVRNMCYV